MYLILSSYRMTVDVYVVMEAQQGHNNVPDLFFFFSYMFQSLNKY